MAVEIKVNVSTYQLLKAKAPKIVEQLGENAFRSMLGRARQDGLFSRVEIETRNELVEAFNQAGINLRVNQRTVSSLAYEHDPQTQVRFVGWGRPAPGEIEKAQELAEQFFKVHASRLLPEVLSYIESHSGTKGSEPGMVATKNLYEEI